MKTLLQIKWLLPFLLMILIGGGACSDDEDPTPEKGYKIIELNMDDHRFENLRTIYLTEDAYCYDIFKRNDSTFILYYGTLLYPIRLPEDFSIRPSEGVVFTGAVKQKPDGVDFHPLILDKIKWAFNIEF